MSIHFHANTHQPGYLPFSDEGYSFETASEAWASLASDLERAWDGEYESAPDGAEGSEERMSIDGRYLDAHTFMHNAPNREGSVHVDGPTETHLGTVYEVTECERDDCGTD